MPTRRILIAGRDLRLSNLIPTRIEYLALGAKVHFVDRIQRGRGWRPGSAFPPLSKQPATLLTHYQLKLTPRQSEGPFTQVCPLVQSIASTCTCGMSADFENLIGRSSRVIDAVRNANMPVDITIANDNCCALLGSVLRKSCPDGWTGPAAFQSDTYPDRWRAEDMRLLQHS